jgi:protocatechuate 3,4-dioxygenase beta subunit
MMNKDKQLSAHFTRLSGALLSVLLLAACAASPNAPTSVAPTIAPTISTPATLAPTTPSIPTIAQPTAAPASIEPTAAQTAAPAAPPIDCTPGAALTPAQTEGPYYKADTPDRSDLIDTATPGTQLIVTGYVLTTDCQPVAGAWLDFWQADDAGAYDNAGYNLRGHQETDATGRYELETVIPGLYPGRTRHIHVKVQAPDGPILTTQLYFPDEAANARDGIFDPALIVNLQTTSSGEVATFNFVVNTR